MSSYDMWLMEGWEDEDHEIWWDMCGPEVVQEFLDGERNRLGDLTREDLNWLIAYKWDSTIGLCDFVVQHISNIDGAIRKMFYDECEKQKCQQYEGLDDI